MLGKLFRLAIAAAVILTPCMRISASEQAGQSDLGASAESPIDKSAKAEADVHLSSSAPDHDGEPMRISMDLQDTNLKDVLKAFSKETGINLIAGTEVESQPITLYLDHVTALDALDQILRAAHLTYERLPGSEIYIVKPDGSQGKAPDTITRIYQLKYARVSKSALAKAAAKFAASTPFEKGTLSDGSSSSSSGSSTAGSTLGSLGSSASSSGSEGGSGDQKRVGGGIGIDEVLKDLLTPNGSVVVDSRTNRLILTDIPENFPRLETVLATLDIRTRQIMVDAELIETSVSKLKDLGVEWGVGSEGDLFSLVPASRTTSFPFSSTMKQILGFGGNPTAGNIAVTNGSLTFGTAGSSSASAVLQALQSDTDTKILARPKVLTLDNESAIIRLTADEAIGFQSSSQATTGTSSSEPQRATTGVVLVVTPQINEDGYITMIVEPTVTKTVASKISAPSGQATPRDPKTRSSRGLIRIRSGDTLVVGGLIDRSDENTLKRVPVLSGIPFLGEAFKNSEINNSTSELIVFITPRILDEPTDAQLATSVTASPLGSREQESTGHHQEVIEQSLNNFEKQRL